MKKIVIFILSTFLISCGGSTTNIYIYTTEKPKISIDTTNSSVIDTIMVQGQDTVDVRINQEEG
jgi:hypothetical protein